MKLPSKDDLAVLREKYPAGTRIRLVQMGQDPSPIPPGTIAKLAARHQNLAYFKIECKPPGAYIRTLSGNIPEESAHNRLQSDRR